MENKFSNHLQKVQQTTKGAHKALHDGDGMVMVLVSCVTTNHAGKVPCVHDK